VEQVAQRSCGCPLVLGLARTGLIFTRSREGTQPGRLTQPGQTEQGVRHHVPLCWVPGWGGGAGRGEGSRGSGAGGALGGERGSVHFAVCFVYSPYQYCCCYCSLHLLFLLNCPYPDPQVFCLFLSILLATLMEEEAIERPRGLLLLATVKLQHSFLEVFKSRLDGALRNLV